jgi:serralysin
MWGDFQIVEGPTQFGQDTFVFAKNNGDDLINDFHQGEDIIEIVSSVAGHIPPQAAGHIPSQAGGQFPQTFADLNIEVVGANSVIHFGNNDSVTVLNVTNLMESDFQFVVI